VDDQVSGPVWSGMSGIGWMIAVSSQPDGLVQAPAPSFGCREVAHQHTHACNPGSWVDPLKDQRSAVEDRVDGERQGNETDQRIGVRARAPGNRR
jgi:hypothetical protein